MYGTQAPPALAGDCQPFENDVKMYGTQARQLFRVDEVEFENDVKMYGTQAMQNTEQLQTQV